MATVMKKLYWVYHEFGLSSLWETGSDAWLLIFSRTLRMFAYGASLFMALFFSTLGFSDTYIGLFMTLTLAGDVLLSLGLTLIADSLGRRKVLFLGSTLMVLSGAVFAYFENYWILLFAAVVGVISATGGDFGPFRAIEESTLSHLTTPKTRADVLSWYVTSSSMGSALGSEACGHVVEHLSNLEGWTSKDAYHKVFLLYVGLGVVNMVLVCLMSENCEVVHKDGEKQMAEGSDATEGLLDERDSIGQSSEDLNTTGPPELSPPSQTLKKSTSPSRLAQISKETRAVMYKLWFLLIVDSLADGMTSYALTTYYLSQKFSLPKSTLGDFISISYFLTSFSSMFAGPLSRRLGLINTMVFTHLPSSAAVLLFPIPQSFWLTISLFFVRTGLNNMDQAPRSAFIAAVVKSDERTAVMGITGMLRTLAATAGPTVTGWLSDGGRFWIAFVVAGSLRICYDLGLWGMFVNMKLYQNDEKESKSVPADSRPARDEEELSELTEVGRSIGER